MLLAACSTPKKLTYFKNMELDVDYIAANAPETRLQKNDRLSVTVFCDEAELARPFNLTTGNEENTVSASYLVENDGCIDYPVIGRVQVEGCTLKESETRIKERISGMGYIKDPVVNVSLENFTITVLGEMTNSVLRVEDDRINLLQAIAMSGGVNIEGNINEVIVIRTEEGNRKAYAVDLQDRDLFDSPVFYLKQNDVLYVKPKGIQISSTGNSALSIFGSTMSFASLIAYLTLLLTR